MKIEKCPFCGCKAILCSTGNHFAAEKFFVSCGVCGVETPRIARTRKEAIAAWNSRADAVPVVRGEWVYAISKGSCMDWHVTAKCSECGWDWFSKEGIGNPGHVFGAFITNGDSKPDETKAFLLENAKSNNSLRFCPNCGTKMEGNA
jgi:Lar family restriction alleviation protein